jgi:hypothetical protein
VEHNFVDHLDWPIIISIIIIIPSSWTGPWLASL